MPDGLIPTPTVGRSCDGLTYNAYRVYQALVASSAAGKPFDPIRILGTAIGISFVTVHRALHDLTIAGYITMTGKRVRDIKLTGAIPPAWTDEVPPPPPFTPCMQTVARIREMSAAGSTPEDIAQAIGVSLQTVVAASGSGTYPPKRPGRPPMFLGPIYAAIRRHLIQGRSVISNEALREASGCGEEALIRSIKRLVMDGLITIADGGKGCVDGRTFALGPNAHQFEAAMNGAPAHRRIYQPSYAPSAPTVQCGRLCTGTSHVTAEHAMRCSAKGCPARRVAQGMAVGK